MGIKCFWLEPTDKRALYLRRFVFSERGLVCSSNPLGIHNASVRIEDVPAEYEEQEGRRYLTEVIPETFQDDPRWPLSCTCGYQFQGADEWRVSQDGLYRRSDTSQVIPLRDAGPGAMWNADWMSGIWQGDDGRCLVVKLPNGSDWVIDSQASNCTMPDDHDQKRHHCWIRHGEPPLITVDKEGVTCGAGAGSIQSGDYHGFLRNGEFS